MEFAQRVERDETNARLSQEIAREKLLEPIHFRATGTIATGPSSSELSIRDGLQASREALRAIADVPFHAMVEAEVETRTGNSTVLLYANERAGTNEPLLSNSIRINIVSWTHPAIQLALTSKLTVRRDISASRYTLKAVRPLARARFKQVIPAISGLYEPGGRVQRQQHDEPRLDHSPRLKAVKLDMTPDQVDAFITRMDGFLLISGAPGTGKTTIAFQRIRFLIDQQSTRPDNIANVTYDAERTRVFLANGNLISYSKQLLTAELRIPENVVSLVADFISNYLEDKWQIKHNARLRLRKLPLRETRAREAFFNLCTAADLSHLWHAFELQVQDRRKQLPQPEWLSIATSANSHAAGLAKKLHAALALESRTSSNPLTSSQRMDGLYKQVKGPYEACRLALDEGTRVPFDAAFARWLFWVYDPLDAVASYFADRRNEATARIRAGTNEAASASSIVADIFVDWATAGQGAASSATTDEHQSLPRQYGPEELSWLAWLLRFTLPEEVDSRNRFRDVPSALPNLGGPRLTHIVIDEAQDLAVQEASFLTSLVHPRGSLTVSADFRQVVSPVHGMDNPQALSFGLPISHDGAEMRFPFKKNMRQARAIGQFLKEFYERTFQEFPPFDAGDRVDGRKPMLCIGSSSLFPRTISQMMAALNTSSTIRSIAVLQLDDDPDALLQLYNALLKERVNVAAPHDLDVTPGTLMLTSVERAKGLEFDACIILGLDDVERASLTHARNRAYVALSRATQRLYMLCQEFPPLMRRMRTDLYDNRSLR